MSFLWRVGPLDDDDDDDDDDDEDDDDDDDDAASFASVWKTVRDKGQVNDEDTPLVTLPLLLLPLPLPPLLLLLLWLLLVRLSDTRDKGWLLEG